MIRSPKFKLKDDTYSDLSPIAMQSGKCKCKGIFVVDKKQYCANTNQCWICHLINAPPQIELHKVSHFPTKLYT